MLYYIIDGSQEGLCALGPVADLRSDRNGRRAARRGQGPDLAAPRVLPADRVTFPGTCRLRHSRVDPCRKRQGLDHLAHRAVLGMRLRRIAPGWFGQAEIVDRSARLDIARNQLIRDWTLHHCMTLAQHSKSQRDKRCEQAVDGRFVQGHSI